MKRHLTIGLLALLASAGNAAAQTQPVATRWEIEGVGGVALIRMRPGGSSALPDPGRPLTTNGPTFPTRETPSWFFGDGAVTLNEVNAQLAARVVPLDAAFGAAGLGHVRGAAVGARVRRGLTNRLTAEFSLDVLPGSTSLSDDLRVAIESTRASFETAFSALLANGPFTNTVVTAQHSFSSESSREVAATGAVNISFSPWGAFAPYVTLGGGTISSIGSEPSVVLEGHYRTTIDADAPAPIDETDRVTLRLEQRRGVVAVLGGGLRRVMSDRWGFRIDGRVFVGPHRTRLLLDAEPSFVPGTPPGFIETLTFPNIQFSNDPATGRRSTLGGPPIQRFPAFTSEGMQTRFLVTVGVFARF